MEGEFLLAIAGLIMKYGVPATIAIIKDWDKDDPTIEDIETLKLMVQKPVSYFVEAKPEGLK